MAISIFDLFSIGIGPSSSHTVGPMRAAFLFADGLRRDGQLEKIAAISVQLYGSLGATGRGHGTDKAIVGGLEGRHPESVDPDWLMSRLMEIEQSGSLSLLGIRPIPFVPQRDLKFSNKVVGSHSNALKLTACNAAGTAIRESMYYSVGGGFVVNEDTSGNDRDVPDATVLPFPFGSGKELLALCEKKGMSISEVMLENEKAWRPESEIRESLLRIWQAMQDCVSRGCSTEGILPGGLKVRRRAAPLLRRLQHAKDQPDMPMNGMNWVDLWALAVNEENAAGGRVVTAPTNGAAGIIPAVLHYYKTFIPGSSDDGVVRFLLTAAAVGTLFKLNASISGAEVGCQGEVGSACSMAAAGLTEVLGGTPNQVENAAEIGMEHNLGLTCDPVGGLVQIPCIERNAMASVKAINASQLALLGDGRHYVSLDKAIRTMRDTGRDMHRKYKETSRGGLAVNVIEC